jgi:hypothetical protein
MKNNHIDGFTMSILLHTGDLGCVTPYMHDKFPSHSCNTPPTSLNPPPPSL